MCRNRLTYQSLRPVFYYQQRYWECTLPIIQAVNKNVEWCFPQYALPEFSRKEWLSATDCTVFFNYTQTFLYLHLRNTQEIQLCLGCHYYANYGSWQNCSSLKYIWVTPWKVYIWKVGYDGKLLMTKVGNGKPRIRNERLPYAEK